MENEQNEKVSCSRRATRFVFGVALVLALAIALVCIGWLCARSGDTSIEVRADVAELRSDVATATQNLEKRLDARLDRIEGKIDALLRIATRPSPDFQPVPDAANEMKQEGTR